MGLFDEATKSVKSFSESVANSAKSVGTSIYSTTRGQSELAGLNVQLNAIEKKLEADYAAIGRKYVAYMEKCETDSTFEVTDILEKMKPELEKKAEVQSQIEAKQQEIKAHNEERAKKKAQDEFDAEKKKLDKAMELEIITDEEYDAKLAVAQKKLDNYDLLRKVDMQYEMEIITKEEYENTKKEILQ